MEAHGIPQWKHCASMAFLHESQKEVPWKHHGSLLGTTEAQRKSNASLHISTVQLQRVPMKVSMEAPREFHLSPHGSTKETPTHGSTMDSHAIPWKPHGSHHENPIETLNSPWGQHGIHQYFRASSSPQIVWDMYTGITSHKGRCCHFPCIGSGNECFMVEQPYNTHFPCVCTK